MVARVACRYGVLLCLVLAVVLAGAGALGGCARKPAVEEPKDPSLENIKKAGKIRVGTDDTYPSMEFRDEKGNLVGFDVDYMEEIARRLGVTVEWIPTEWDGIIPALKARKFDAIISGMNITEKRKEEVNFTNPYLALGQVIVVHKNNTTIKGLSDLVGKTIAVQIGTTNEDVARRIQGANVKTCDSFVDAFTELELGRADAVIVDEPVGQYYMAIRPIVYKVVGESFERAPVGIALRKGEEELLKAINKIVADMRQDGGFDKLSLKWFGAVLSDK